MPNQIGWNLKLLGLILQGGQIHRWDFKGGMAVIAVCTQDLQMLGWWKMVGGIVMRGVVHGQIKRKGGK